MVSMPLLLLYTWNVQDVGKMMNDCLSSMLLVPTILNHYHICDSEFFLTVFHKMIEGTLDPLLSLVSKPLYCTFFGA